MNNKNRNIPEEILKIIHSGDVYSRLEKIGSKYNLHLDQLGDLNIATEKTMVGKLKSSKFIETISKNLNISEETAENIANDINREIMDPIRSSLQKMQEEENTETEEEYQTIQKPEKNPTITQQTTTPQTPTTSQIPKAETVTPQINNTPSQNTEPPVFVAKTIAIPKPEPVAIPAIRPKTLDEAGRFTIEKPPVGIPQYKDESIKKEVILGMIEDEGINDPEPITISVPSYIPEKSNYTPPAPTPTPTPAPVQTNTETPIVKAPPQIEKKSYTVDPYREQI